jgi:anion transporter
MDTSPVSVAKPSAVASTGQKVDIRIAIGRILCVVAPLALWFYSFNLDVSTNARHALAIGLFMIIAWISDALPHVITGLIGCVLFWSLHVVGFESAFGGFSTIAPWFFFGAMVFGMLATETGLANRLAYHLMLRFGNRYSQILLGMVVLSFLLTFIVPSGAVCVVIMAAVAIGLLEAYGVDRNSNIARGMFLTLTYTAGLFDKMVVAGPASILGRELIMKTTHTNILWSEWFIAYLPFSLLTILATWRVVLWMFPPEQNVLSGGEEYLRGQLRKMGKVSHREMHGAILMLIALALWGSDSLHHISPAVIAMCIAMIALLPRVGILTAKDLQKVNYMNMFFIATAASLGDVLIQTKALDLLTHFTFSWMTPLLTNKFSLTFVPYIAGFVYHIFLGNDITMLATSIAPLTHFAVTHGFDPVALGMIWVFTSGGKIFVYQSGVLIIGYGYGYFSTKDLLRLGLVLSVVEIALVVLLVPFYWPLIGI